ncbi:MAG: AbrB/MazE/SpoVT family DNA-binding domain-containing protein [Microcoleaceae cyanobacterium]
MDTTIRTRIIKIGNSQVICIPKILLEQSGIDQDVEIYIQDRSIVLPAASQSREGWEEAFATMSAQQDDILIDEMTANNWDDLEWEW